MTSMFASWLPGRVGISYNQFFGLDIGPERARFYARMPEMFPPIWLPCSTMSTFLPLRAR